MNAFANPKIQSGLPCVCSYMTSTILRHSQCITSPFHAHYMSRSRRMRHAYAWIIEISRPFEIVHSYKNLAFGIEFEDPKNLN